MADVTIDQYLELMDKNLSLKMGQKAMELFSCRDLHIRSPHLQQINLDNLKRIVRAPWSYIIASHISCINAINQNNFIEAYKFQAGVIQTFIKIFQEQKEENWALPIMYTMCLDLRLIALNADKQICKKEMLNRVETLENAAELLMSCIRVCANDNRSPQFVSKRWGLLNIVNQLFKIYFKINKLHLCKPLIRAIDNSALKNYFNLSQLVTYRYYVGRKALFENNLKVAEECLSFAFIRCHKQSKRNKRLILIHLLPIKILLGQFPNVELLKKYDLIQFEKISQSVKEGNLLLLNETFKSNESFFIKYGIYLVLEKLKTIAYRNLFKKISLLMKTHRIPVEACLSALKFVKFEGISLDEVHCILANLIYEGKVKGYISWQHQILVVSKQNAFPSLSNFS